MGSHSTHASEDPEQNKTDAAKHQENRDINIFLKFVTLTHTAMLGVVKNYNSWVQNLIMLTHINLKTELIEAAPIASLHKTTSYANCAILKIYGFNCTPLPKPRQKHTQKKLKFPPNATLALLHVAELKYHNFYLPIYKDVMFKHGHCR